MKKIPLDLEEVILHNMPLGNAKIAGESECIVQFIKSNLRVSYSPDILKWQYNNIDNFLYGIVLTPKLIALRVVEQKSIWNLIPC